MRFARILPPFLALFLAVFLALPARADVHRSRGQVIYVPAYSHIYHGIKKPTPFYLAVTLSIRNTDPKHSLALTSVQYYDTDGKMLREFVPTPVTVGPMATKEFIIMQFDKEGGSGANFLLTWEAGVLVTDPIAEAVMIGTSSNQGISFLTAGQIIEERP